ncbi:MAG: cyclic nucleotide-binding domain-containing protein [Thermoanaerobacteraceae bacterium]|nr:cyclic nucleotide-binding domain-containing protein [Thermoanaerobacteraceae bacterium]
MKLVQYTEEGREIILDVVGRGEVLGETALFQQQKHFASAIALEMVKVCFISLN